MAPVAIPSCPPHCPIGDRDGSSFGSTYSRLIGPIAAREPFAEPPGTDVTDEPPAGNLLMPAVPK